MGLFYRIVIHKDVFSLQGHVKVKKFIASQGMLLLFSIIYIYGINKEAIACVLTLIETIFTFI